jgi:heme/copper-type cytochrome/quinol oxidase subunit 2
MTTPAPAPVAGPRTNVLAIIALIAAFVIPLAGIIVGFIAQNQIKQTGEAGAGLAKAGIILGFVFTILGIIGIIIYAVSLASLAGLATTYGY